MMMFWFGRNGRDNLPKRFRDGLRLHIGVTRSICSESIDSARTP